MLINKLWIACTALMVGILWVMVFVHQEQIIKQGRQIKQLEVALSVYTWRNQMILPRWRAEYDMYITSHPKGDFVELKDVIKMLEDAKIMDICGVPLTIEYQTLWDAGIDQLINELKKESK